MVKKKAIFFDRDGILIKAPVDKDNKPKSIKKVEEIQYVRGVKKIVKKLKKKYLLIMVTNQPDFKRNENTLKNIKQINRKIEKDLVLDDIYVCYCKNDKCKNRKPNPGMIIMAKKKYNLDLNSCYFIGDRWRDLGAAKKSGCKSIFLDYDYNEKVLYKPDFMIKNLVGCLKIINA